MYAELIKRLRDCRNMAVYSKFWWDITTEAADAIEELQKALDAVNDAHNEGYDVGYWAGRRDYEPKWIPVTERLPVERTNPNTRDFEYVLCSTSFGDVRAYKFGALMEWDEPHFWHGAGLVDEYVLAWMPLPKPWKGEDNAALH